MPRQEPYSARGGQPAAPRHSGAGKGPAPVLAIVLVVFSLLAWAGTAAFGETGTLAVTATVLLLSKSQCKFDTNTATLNFGALDPAVAADVNGTASVD